MVLTYLVPKVSYDVFLRVAEECRQEGQHSKRKITGAEGAYNGRV
jgi:hypothetical protein